jgi:hypothetical protein
MLDIEKVARTKANRRINVQLALVRAKLMKLGVLQAQDSSANTLCGNQCRSGELN